MLTFSSKNLRPDCAAVELGNETKVADMDEATALELLRAFAQLPPVELVDSDAVIHLAGANDSLEVHNENGRLFSRRLPVATHTAIEQSPEQIIASIGGRTGSINETSVDGTPRSETSVSGVEAPSPAIPPKRGAWRPQLDSPWLLLVLAIIAGTMAYFTFSDEVPADIQIIKDSTRIASLNSTFSGRYGIKSVGANVLQIANGRFTVHTNAGSGSLAPPILDLDYQYGLRAGQVVLLLGNGAVLELGPDKSLRFNEAAYPRM